MHVLIRDAVVDQCLIPDRVPRVAQGFGPQLVGLEPREEGQADVGLSGEPVLEPQP